MTERPNLLYILNEFPSLYQGTVVNEIHNLQSLGYPVHILALHRPDHPNHTALESLRRSITYGLNLQDSRWAVLKANLALIFRVGPAAYWGAWKLANRFRFMDSFRGFMRLAAAIYKLCSRGYTHLHAHWAAEATELAMISARLLGLPFSFTGHAADLFIAPRHLEAKLRAARFVVTVSSYNKQYLVAHYSLDLEDKVHVIYPLVDLSQFAPRSAGQSAGITILSVGRLVEKKGYPYAITAARLLKEQGYSFVWQIVGEGAERPQLEAAIEEQGLTGWVQLLGSLPQNRVKSLLDQTTVFVLPCVVASNGDRDGMPQVLIEAMAKEVPVITTTAVGINELVRDGAGLLVPPGDSVALAEAVEQIITADSAARQAMGRIGRRIVEREFDGRHLAHKLTALFEANSH